MTRPFRFTAMNFYIPYITFPIYSQFNYSASQSTTFDSTRVFGGGVLLPYVTLTETCGPIGYGFQGVLS